MTYIYASGIVGCLSLIWHALGRRPVKIAQPAPPSPKFDIVAFYRIPRRGGL